MNITPLYELRTRLKNVMIAGTNLISEDFRLKRAVESFQPLAGIAPVFARINKLTNELLEPEREDKETVLLEAITLLDAVLCTQATVAVDKPISSLPSHKLHATIKNIPYSITKPLINALTTSGGKRALYVEALHNEHPELFSDYRVKLAMMQALGDSYRELANMVQEWLKEEGEENIPLLQFGFDAKGKKDMVRRVEIIDAVCGAKANDFYCSMIKEAEKEVRVALIHALRHDPKNIELLLSLAKSEVGNSKKMVFFVLANYEDEAVSEFFKKMYQKKPRETVCSLYLSKTVWASELVAKYMKEKLSKWEEKAKNTGESFFDENEEKEWLELVNVLVGKNGTAIREAIMQTVDLADSFHLPVQRTYYTPYTCFYTSYSYFGNWTLKKGEYFQSALANTLKFSLRLNPTSDLSELALELYKRYGEENEKNPYFSSAITAKLLSDEDCAEWIHERISVIKKQQSSPKGTSLTESLEGLFYDGEKWKMVTKYQNESLSQFEDRIQPIYQKIEDGVLDILIKCYEYDKERIYLFLSNPANLKNPTFCSKVESYFYKKALISEKPENYMDALKVCGCSRCEGLLVHAIKAKKRTLNWIYDVCLRKLPGDGNAIVEEAMRAFELLNAGKLEIFEVWNESAINKYMAMIEDIRKLEKITDAQ